LTTLKSYLDTILILREHAIDFVVTGTFALYLQKKNFGEQYEIKDCDIFITYTQENLLAFLTCMQANGWKVKIWEEEIDFPRLMEQAEGKYYIRCTKNDLIFDATYEHEAAIYGDPAVDTIYVNNIPVIDSKKILSGKKYRGYERDLAAVEVFESL